MQLNYLNLDICASSLVSGYQDQSKPYRLPVIGCRDLSVNLGALFMKSEEYSVLRVADATELS